MVWFKIMIKFGKKLRLKKINIYSIMINKKMWSMGAIICISNSKLQKISFKNYFIWKSEKGQDIQFKNLKKSMLYKIFHSTHNHNKQNTNLHHQIL
jgi:hypothetical protein